MSLIGKYVEAGEVCWLHFNTKLGQTQAGDYAYQECYAKNRSEKIENGEVYVKVIIYEIVWKYNHICFNIRTVNKDGTEIYETQCYEPERLTLINEE